MQVRRQRVLVESRPAGPLLLAALAIVRAPHHQSARLDERRDELFLGRARRIGAGTGTRGTGTRGRRGYRDALFLALGLQLGLAQEVQLLRVRAQEAPRREGFGVVLLGGLGDLGFLRLGELALLLPVPLDGPGVRAVQKVRPLRLVVPELRESDAAP